MLKTAYMAYHRGIDKDTFLKSGYFNVTTRVEDAYMYWPHVYAYCPEGAWVYRVTYREEDVREYRYGCCPDYGCVSGWTDNDYGHWIELTGFESIEVIAFSPNIY